MPDDWEQLTVNGVTVRLPADFTVDAEDSTVYDFRCNDVNGYVCFSDDGDVDVNELYKTMMDMADLKKVFGSFGLEFDDTTRSMFGNFLKLSEEDIRYADEKTRDELSNFGGLFFFTEKAYDVEKSGCELFISDMKDSLRDDEGNDAYSVDIFDDNSELSVITVNCRDELTALRIAASADLQ